MGRKPKDNQNKLELSCKESTTDLTHSELTSLWPDQWQLKEQYDNTMTDHKDPWLDLEGMNL